jgi:hypothetical protein
MSPTTPLPWSDMRTLARVLLHATPASRRAVALRLLEADDPTWWPLLASTVRSDEDWRLRARCLEVLGLAAGSAGRHTHALIETALLSGPGSPPQHLE